MTNKPNDALLPCPFCASTDVKIVTDDGSHFAQCRKCEATGPTGFKRGDEDDADWNSRAKSADQQGEPVMRLEAEKLWGGDGEYSVDFVKPGWLKECREKGGTFLLYASAQPATAKVDDALRDKLQELLSAVRSINHSPRSEVRMIGDDEPCYTQRKEWVHWLLSICDEAEEVAKLNTPQ
ncbi:hypothetical protein GIV19_12005 [Pseudomonas syringae]|uniref:hypothetical protein n=1 Tax=Pseudomonas syringae TaxID=317 RepID=UPI001F3B4E04|nr:hypothetical protein [Pseudomonas syringae]MCF5708012.1 hypothetical protein [Pseudomonas syringae]